jgi:hypothetical protein
MNNSSVTLNRKDLVVRAICDAIGYRGRKIKASMRPAPNQLNSYWDGGSKDTYYFYHLDEKKIFQLPTNHPFFEKDKPRDLNGLPPRVILIESSIFCGKHAGLTIYSNESDRSLLIGGSNE